MFTCKDENRAAIYLIRDTKTGKAYVGATLNVAVRLAAHRACIGSRKAYSDRHALKMRKSFPRLSDVEFRILEFVVLPKTSSRVTNEQVRTANREAMREREHHWIAALKPSENRQLLEMIAVEDLPYGAPEPHMTGKKTRAAVTP